MSNQPQTNQIPSISQIVESGTTSLVIVTLGTLLSIAIGAFDGDVGLVGEAVAQAIFAPRV